MVTRGARSVKLSIRLGKPTGEAMFGGGGVDFKTLAPAGQASRGQSVAFAPCQLARQDRTF
jgi:hypothetical protein